MCSSSCHRPYILRPRPICHDQFFSHASVAPRQTNYQPSMYTPPPINRNTASAHWYSVAPLVSTTPHAQHTPASHPTSVRTCHRVSTHPLLPNHTTWYCAHHTCTTCPRLCARRHSSHVSLRLMRSQCFLAHSDSRIAILVR